MPPRRIVVVDYDPSWAVTFEQLRSRIWPAVADVALAIEHVGSTAVPGLAAKPIVDMTLVVPAADDMPAVANRLGGLGYLDRGNLGIEGREAFDAADGQPAHNLYVCARDAVALANHLTLRHYLRHHAERAREYGALKKRLAERFPYDIDRYVEGKTGFIVDVLRAAGCPDGALRTIRSQNRVHRPPG